jgi:hypothetical protein
MKSLVKRTLLTLLMVSGAVLAQESPQLDLPHVKLTAGIHQIDAQVAQTPRQREIGLMFRRDMPQYEVCLRTAFRSLLLDEKHGVATDCRIRG